MTLAYRPKPAAAPRPVEAAEPTVSEKGRKREEQQAQVQSIVLDFPGRSELERSHHFMGDQIFGIRGAFRLNRQVAGFLLAARHSAKHQ